MSFHVHCLKYSCSTVVLATATTVDNLVGLLTEGLFIAGDATDELKRASSIHQVSVTSRMQSTLTYQHTTAYLSVDEPPREYHQALQVLANVNIMKNKCKQQQTTYLAQI